MTMPANMSYDSGIPGEIRVTLKWNEERSIIDKIFNRPKPVLALGCYYITDFGGKSLIDRLQFVHNHGGRERMTRQGSFDMVPYIWHEGTGRADNGECIESIIINNSKLEKLRRITLYTFIIKGKPRWKRIAPVLSFEIPGQEPVVFEFNAKPKRKRKVYAIVDIEINGDSLNVKPLHTLHRGHGDCNVAHEWGLNVAP